MSMVDDSATYKTLRELVRSFNDSTFYLERFSEIDFELNHLELHDLDDYLLTCYYREVGDPKNKNNSNIKYLLGLTEVIAEGAIVTKGGSFPD